MSKQRETIYVLTSAQSLHGEPSPIAATKSTSAALGWVESSDESRKLFRAFELVELWSDEDVTARIEQAKAEAQESE